MINLKMADGIRLMTLRRGVDPRKFALLSFGGAAGLHAAEVARELEIKRIIVPTVASVLSAWGMLTSDLRYEVSRTHYGAGPRISANEVRELFAQLEQQAAGRLRVMVQGAHCRSSAPPRCVTASRSLRSTCRWTVSNWNAADLVDQIEDRFHRRHEELYTYASRGQEVVFVNARVAAVGEVSQRDQDTRLASSSGRLRAARQAAGLVRRLARRAGLCARQPAARPFPDGSRDHRGRDHDGAGRHRRPRDRQCAGLAGYCAALTIVAHLQATRLPQTSATFDFNNLVLSDIIVPPGRGVTSCHLAFEAMLMQTITETRIALFCLAAMFLALAPASAQQAQEAAAADTEIRIGNIMPYTGPLAAFAAIGRAEAAYFDMVNERGGINGRKIKFISAGRQLESEDGGRA